MKLAEFDSTNMRVSRYLDAWEQYEERMTEKSQTNNFYLRIVSGRKLIIERLTVVK